MGGVREKTVDKQEKTCIIVFVRRNTAGLCKGSTADSDSVCEGSNPSPAAIKNHRNSDRITVVFSLSKCLFDKLKSPAESLLQGCFHLYISLCLCGAPSE